MTETAVDIGLIAKEVEVACRAPSLHNSQPWRWLASSTAVDLLVEPHRVVRTQINYSSLFRSSIPRTNHASFKSCSRRSSAILTPCSLNLNTPIQ